MNLSLNVQEKELKINTTEFDIDVYQNILKFNSICFIISQVRYGYFIARQTSSEILIFHIQHVNYVLF